jgi:hypothetical protein
VCPRFYKLFAFIRTVLRRRVHSHWEDGVNLNAPFAMDGASQLSIIASTNHTLSRPNPPGPSVSFQPQPRQRMLSAPPSSSPKRAQRQQQASRQPVLDKPTDTGQHGEAAHSVITVPIRVTFSEAPCDMHTSACEPCHCCCASVRCTC